MNNIKNLENKYAELLLKRCLSFNNTKSLLIKYSSENTEFVKRLEYMATKMGITDICLYLEDQSTIHDELIITDIAKIKDHPLFHRSKWNEYALKDSAFLFLETELPGLMADIEPAKIEALETYRNTTYPVYKEKQMKYQVPWCIACFPNERWAKDIFPNDANAYKKLFIAICQMCMVDQENPILAWDEELKRSNHYKNKLNELEIKRMHYTNSLGTDLTITLPENNIWLNPDKYDSNGNPILVNMPSYEIFTTPHYQYTEGIVYSTKPLVYNGGLIDQFSVEFNKGKVVNLKAKTGLNILKLLVNEKNQTNYLGEVALVNYDSPIARIGIAFGTTLFDENASCHLAFGRGNPKNIKDGVNMNHEQLMALGINITPHHTDFMIGSEDLNIEVQTPKGKVLIFKNGKFNL